MCVQNLVPIGPQSTTCIPSEGHTHTYTYTHTLSYIDIDYDIPFLLQEKDTSNLLESVCSSSTSNKVRVNKNVTLTNEDILSKR